MPTNLRNIIFIIICICALSIAFVYQGAKVAHVLPSSFNNGTYSYLEGSKLQTRPKVTIQNIKKGTFQNQTEKWITTKVPKRDSVMLFNAKVQRGMIRAANLACGFDTIPTYFGSKHCFNSNLEVVTETSAKETPERNRRMLEAADAINEFKANHQEMSFTVALPDRLTYSEANPSFSLVSNAESTKTRQENFVRKLNSQVKFVDLSISDEEEHAELFFKTDHHWNIKGSASGYSKIMTQAYPELSQVEFGDMITYEMPAFYGSYARSGLMTDGPVDAICDYIVDLSDIQIKINNKDCTAENVEHIEMYREKKYSTNRLASRYGEYFHHDKAKIEYHSDRGGGRNLLLIADSFSNSCERYFAKSFDSVVAIDQRYNEENLDDIIVENNITDVLLMVNPSRFDDGVNTLTKWKK